MLDLEEELGAVIDALNAANVEYALCGGLALAVHGEAGATADVDLCVTRTSMPVFTQVVSSFGVGILKLHPVPVDTAVGGGVWDRRAVVQWDRRLVPVVTFADASALHVDHGRAAVDYSERAVTQRIRQASQLRKLCLSLGKSKPIARPPPVSKS